jgi:hypothetical protein
MSETEKEINDKSKKREPKAVEYSVVEETGCHLCTSHAIRPDGKIEVRRGGKIFSLVRLLYEEANGPLAPEQILFNTCGTKGCINLAHYQAGTQQDKVASRVARDRSARGSHNGRAKLSEEIVREIRLELDKKTPSVQLARQYGVDHHIISRIQKGLIWKHVQLPQELEEKNR